MKINDSYVKPMFTEPDEVGNDDPFEDLRHLIDGDPTKLWKTAARAVTSQSPVKNQLRVIALDIIRMLPETFKKKDPVEVAGSKNEVVMRVEGTHNHVLPIVALIVLRYWDHTSTVECDLRFKDDIYAPSSNHEDFYSLKARSEEELADLKYQAAKHIRSRVP